MSRSRKRLYWDLHVYRPYYALIKRDLKTLEVRVAYRGMGWITVGAIIRFNEDNDCKRRVARVARYQSFAEMLGHEDTKKIDPNVSSRDMLRVLQTIYPPKKERLGVLVFELEPA